MMITESKTIPLHDLIHDPEAIKGREGRLIEISDLYESIRNKGVLQSLLARPVRWPGKGSKTVHGVVGGNRRLAALKALLADGHIKPDYPVPVIVAKQTDAEVHENAAIENLQRVPMTPVQEFLAYGQLRDDGHSVGEIALLFVVPERRVAQRLGLAALHPDVLKALDEKRITLDAAAAFTVQPDAEKQAKYLREALEGGNTHRLLVGNIRFAMIEEHLDADSDLARMIGEDAYLAAGGVIERDLFGEDVFWVSADVVAQLTQTAWAEKVGAWMEEGWGWVMSAAEFSAAHGSVYQTRRVYPVPVARSPQDEKEMEDLEGRITDYDERESEPAHEEEAEYNRWVERHDALDEAGKAFSAEAKAGAGIVYDTADGDIWFGIVKPEAKLERGAGSAATGTAAAPKADLDSPGDMVSGYLAEKLTEALQDKVGKDPDLALRICVATLHAQMRRMEAPPLHLAGARITNSRGPGDAELVQGNTFDGALAWANKQDRDGLLTYLAQLVALSIDVRVTWPCGSKERRALIEFVDPDPTPFYEPEHFFNNVRKPVIALAFLKMTGTVLKEGKKGEMAATAAGRAKELGWLPLQLRTPSYGVLDINPAPEPEADEQDDTEQIEAAE